MSNSEDTPEVNSKVVSLDFRRKNKNRSNRKTYLSADIRFREAEEDINKLIDLIVDHEQRLDKYERIIHMLLGRIREGL